ncbi:MAG: hypothetical protein GC200_00215 [Tepidisphaera sp.]|nr:hypothetical protein [Tepidisphaera sp.]
MAWGVDKKAWAAGWGLAVGLALIGFVLSYFVGAGTTADRVLGYVLKPLGLWSAIVYFLVSRHLGRRHLDMVVANGWRCPKCEYLLEGLPARGTCPECSHEYDVATSLKDAKAELEGVRDVRT